MRRDGEEVLREPVVDLARETRALVGNGATELGGLDRAPDADAEDAVAEHAQEVAGRDLDVAESGVNTRCSDEKSMSDAPNASQRSRSSSRSRKRRPKPTTAARFRNAFSE